MVSRHATEGLRNKVTIMHALTFVCHPNRFPEVSKRSGRICAEPWDVQKHLLPSVSPPPEHELSKQRRQRRQLPQIHRLQPTAGWSRMHVGCSIPTCFEEATTYCLAILLLLGAEPDRRIRRRSLRCEHGAQLTTPSVSRGPVATFSHACALLVLAQGAGRTSSAQTKQGVCECSHRGLLAKDVPVLLDR